MIDPKLLPERAVVDSSFLVASRKHDEVGSDLSRSLWNALVKNARHILIPAPALAEFLRRPPHTPPPRIERVEVVAFDEIAAITYGTTFPPTAFTASTSGLKPTLKFDAMIVACGLRHKADCLITLDERQLKFSETMGLPARHPSEFQSAQGALDLVGQE